LLDLKTARANFQLDVLRCVEDYEGALAILTEMTYFAHERGTPVSGINCQLSGAFADILSSCELSRVLLLLLLQASGRNWRYLMKFFTDEGISIK
jgi:hypothetical protein